MIKHAAFLRCSQYDWYYREYLPDSLSSPLSVPQLCKPVIESLECWQCIAVMLAFLMVFGTAA